MGIIGRVSLPGFLLKALQTITARAREANLRFLLAGGHAVIAHGHARTTFDMDLLIPREDRDQWVALALTLGYALFRESANFVQFSPPQGQAIPLYCMLVSSETFRGLNEEAVQVSALPHAKMVSLSHLLALKCHAIKHGHTGRIVKDVDDVINLIKANRLDMKAPESRELFLQYGTLDHAKESTSPPSDSTPLELPDGSGMESGPQQMSAHEAFELCEQYAAIFPAAAQRARELSADKCDIEFVL